MKFDFSEKVIVITGGATGIGLSTAEAFGKLGGIVSICGRTESKLNIAKKELELKGIGIHTKVVDVTNKNELFEYATEVEKILGSIDIWINNAGIYPIYKIVDTPEDVWNQAMEINLKSIYYGALIAKEKMTKYGGVIINASSYASIIPSIGSGLYAATKAAVSSMTRTLAGELAPYNIRVNAYAPGVIETEMTFETIKGNKEKIQKVTALNRIGKIDEVSNTIVFLASDYASYITGSVVEISGGKFCVQNPEAAWN